MQQQQFEGSGNSAFAAFFYANFPAPGQYPAFPPHSDGSKVPHYTYDRMYQVGTGTYGSVFKAKCHETGEIVALKKIKLDSSQKRHGFPIPAIREIKYLTQARHANSVRLFEIAKGDESADHIMTLVFEYVESDMVGYLSAIKLTEPHRLCIMKQLLDGLFYAHVNRICHRDLKPANILINRAGIVKIADWGMSRQVLPNRTYTNEVVTIWYRAPELVLGERRYGTEVDMWALGCVFAELYLGKPLLPGQNEEQQMRQTMQLLGRPNIPGWDKLSRASLLSMDVSGGGGTNLSWDTVFAAQRPSLVSLLRKLLCYDPKLRASAHLALDDDLFWGADMFSPCAPNMLPTPRGDGVHEFQLRENEMQQAKRQRELART